MRLFISMLLILSMRLSAENKYDDINIVFINGIQNPVKQAESSAKALSAAIGLPESRTKAIYNETRGFLADIAETYAYGNFDGTNGGKDFTKFWQLVNGWKKYEGRTYARPPSQALKNWYLREIRDGFLKYQGDYQDVYTEVKKLRDASPNKKLLILSHSEGTVVANLVMKELLSDYPDSQSYSAKECTRLVSIATPVSASVGIRNGGVYTTSDEDMVIGAIRADMSSLPSNFNGVYDSTNDFKGHGLKEIYLNRGTGRRLIGSGYRLWRPNGALRNRIISQIGTMADEINCNCALFKVTNVDTWATTYYKEGMSDDATLHHYRVTYTEVGGKGKVITLEYKNCWYEAYDEDDDYIPYLSRELPFSTSDAPSSDESLEAWNSYYTNKFENNIPEDINNCDTSRSNKVLGATARRKNLRKTKNDQ